MKYILRKYRDLMKAHNRFLLLLEIIFMVIFLVFIIPLFSSALERVLRLWGHSYITSQNLISFLIYPPALLVLLLILIAIPIYILYNMTALIQHCNNAALHKKQNILHILAISFLRTLKTIFSKNIGLPFFAFFIFIFTNMPLLIGVTFYARLPIDFVKGSSDEIFIKGMIILCLLFISFVAFRGIFIVHFCINDQNDFLTAIDRTKLLLKGRSLKAALRLILYNICLTLIFYFVYNVVLIISAFLTYLFADRSMVITVFLSHYPKINIFTSVIFSMIAYVSNINLISTMFIHFRHEENLSFSPEYDLLELPISSQPKNRRRLVTVILILLVSVGLINFYIAIRNDSFYLKDALSGIQITAHRGYAKVAPENTLPAIEKAIEIYSDYAEIDIQQTKDGVIVLLHDKSLMRTTGLRRNLWDVTYDQVRELDAGSWFSPDFIGTPIPTLEEVLALSKGRIRLNLDIKIHGYEKNLAEKLVQLIEQYEFEYQCVVTSWNYDILVQIKKLNDKIKTGYIMSAAYGNFYDKAYIDFFSIRSSFISRSVVENAHRIGKEIHAWNVYTVNDNERMKALGVDNIISGDPTLTKEVLYRDLGNENLIQMLNRMMNNHTLYQLVRFIQRKM